MAHAQSQAQSPDRSHYYIPPSSVWPIVAAVSLVSLMLGAGTFLNGWGGAQAFLPGAVLLALTFTGWFHRVIVENQDGDYNLQVDRSFRLGMLWFIFSEVMFFAVFFSALYYTRIFVSPWLAGHGAHLASHKYLWSDFTGAWPNNGPAHVGGLADGSFKTVPAFGVPLLNTLILLASGVTVTIAHHALRARHRGVLSVFLAATFLLGFTFVVLQAHEYGEAYHELGLKLSTGIYGSTFFMLTGFHGLHVTIGAIMLTVIWLRVLRGHFTPERHFAFEAVAWYWHFVDVVWLGLFIFVYWL